MVDITWPTTEHAFDDSPDAAESPFIDAIVFVRCLCYARGRNVAVARLK